MANKWPRFPVLKKYNFLDLGWKTKWENAYPVELDLENIPWKVPSKLSQSVQRIVSIIMIHGAKCTCKIALF